MRMIFNTHFGRYWLPVILWMAFIFWMSTGTFSSDNTASLIEPILRSLFSGISFQALDLVHAMIRKAGHVMEYFILGLLAFRAFRGDSKESWNWRWASLAMIVVILWALSDEFHQSFVPERTASAGDVGIDAAGGIVAQFVNALRVYRRKR